MRQPRIGTISFEAWLDANGKLRSGPEIKPPPET
jgi:hypothetical protein